MSDKIGDMTILAVQAAGFIAAILTLIAAPGSPEIFAASFMVHLVGDVLRFEKDQDKRK